MAQLSRKAFLKTFDRKILVSWGIPGGLGLLLFFFFLLPSCHQAHELEQQIDQKQNQLIRDRSKIQEALKIQKNRDLYLIEIRTKEQKFFGEDESSDLLNIISDMAKFYNLQMTASKPIASEPPQSSGPPSQPLPAVSAPVLFSYPEQNFEIQLSGEYHALGKFLSALKKQPKLICIKKLSISNSPASPVEHEIHLNLAVYAKLLSTT
jgi:hypothetical protein